MRNSNTMLCQSVFQIYNFKITFFFRMKTKPLFHNNHNAIIIVQVHSGTVVVLCIELMHYPIGKQQHEGPTRWRQNDVFLFWNQGVRFVGWRQNDGHTARRLSLGECMISMQRVVLGFAGPGAQYCRGAWGPLLPRGPYAMMTQGRI